MKSLTAVLTVIECVWQAGALGNVERMFRPARLTRGNTNILRIQPVRIAPSPGGLRKLTARHPHPQGWIEVDLDFAGTVTKGRVTTPVDGTFVCPLSGQTVELKAGVTVL